MDKLKDWLKKYGLLTVTALFTIYVIVSVLSPTASENIKEVPYTEFTKMVTEEKVAQIQIDLSASNFTFTDADKKKYVTDNPKSVKFKEDMLNKGIDIKEIDPKAGKAMGDMIRSIVSMLIMVAIIMVAFTWFQKKTGKFNKNPEVTAQETTKKTKDGRHKRTTTTFAQIAGNEEAKEDMKFLVDFLKNPKKYVEMGAKLPSGVIFYGEPGTGKTLMAKALAGEAGVPFFSMSGSDFVEMYVGVGASRVRDLFETARKKSPSIIFIDEIDSLGGKRNKEQHSEQRQTLNAILKELDGFDSNDGIIVIGATNRLEDLDEAFIRPGRFDKHIAIDLPDQKSRLAILNLHAKNKKLDNDVDLEELSKLTIGLSGASLEAIMNESAIIATTKDRKKIAPIDVDDAYYKVLMQGHKKTGEDKRDKEEIRLVAWHEAGHALTAKLLTDKEVPKVTIIPSTSGAGGVAFIIPKKTGLHTKEDLMNDIKISYAGRAAEYLLRGSEDKITTGASSDIENATAKIYTMITRVGMSEKFGMLNLEQFGNNLAGRNSEILDEASALSKQLYKETVELLTANKDVLEAIAEGLMEKETLKESDLDEIIARYNHKKESVA